MCEMGREYDTLSIPSCLTAGEPCGVPQKHPQAYTNKIQLLFVISSNQYLNVNAYLLDPYFAMNQAMRISIKNFGMHSIDM